ncbi:MAG: hypothetical protein F4X16_10950 [Caldilineaceae bacterium SB0661_bin_34]|nr:hypothetical protein [Caldilineaceae bacterium SB0661_bin_34]
MAHSFPQFLSSAPGKCLARLFLALLALAVISGGSLAAGDLFDNDYKDCPHKTRLRDGQISDLSVNRDSDEEDEVNVSWATTDPETWGLGPNKFRTSLVVILDDGISHTESESLGTTKVTFDNVDTGRVVTVQMAIVVDTADGKYLISDILEKRINQSLTEPAFSTAWRQVTGVTLPTRTGKAGDLKVNSQAVAGMLYYVGYNENFGNYKSDDSDMVTTPSTARLRIGLAHSSNETDVEREDVEFDAYIIRIEDEDGDVVSEGDDVATVASSYKSDRDAVELNHDGVDTTDAFSLKTPVALFLYGVTQDPTFATSDKPEERTINDYALSNVRIVDGDDITVAAHVSSAVINRNGGLVPGYLSMVKVDSFDLANTGTITPAVPDTSAPDADDNGNDASYALTTTAADIDGTVFAEAPNEHRDFPIDTFTSDTTYTITAWAINEDDEVISPVATLKVRPKDTERSGTVTVTDYKMTAAGIDGLTTTEFTVLK